MKKVISISDFEFKYLFPGHYIVRYMSPYNGKCWDSIITDMNLIDDTKGEGYEAKKTRLNDLKRLIKQVN